MAVAFDAGSSVTSAGANVATLSLTTLTVTSSGSNLALVAAITWNSALPTGITLQWDSAGTPQTMTQLTTVANGTSCSTAIYTLIAPHTGNKTLKATWTGSTEAIMAAASWTGVNQTGGATSFPHTANSTASPTSVVVTSSSGNAVYAGHGWNDGGGTPSLTLNQTSITNDVPGDALGTNRAAGAASVTMTCSNSLAPPSAALGVDIAAAAGLPFTPILGRHYDLTPRSVSGEPYYWDRKYSQGSYLLPLITNVQIVMDPDEQARDGPDWYLEYGLNYVLAHATPFNQFDWPLPQDSRLKWYQSFEAFYNRNLIGKDVLPNRIPYPQPGPLNWYQDYEVNYVLTHAQPFVQKDWPNPYPVQWYREWQRVAQLLEELAIPFNQTDWPVPVPPSRLEQTTAAFYNRNLIGKDVLPFRIPVPLPGPLNWYQSQETNLQYLLAIPFKQTDWPNPFGPQSPYREWYLASIRSTPNPFFQTDWPNPQPVQWYKSFEAFYNRNLIGQDVLPFRIPVSFPGPLNWYQEQYLNFVLTHASPFNQYDWPNPVPLKWYQDWSRAVIEEILEVPFVQTDWPNPFGYPRLEQTVSAFYNRNLIGQDVLPFRVPYPQPGPLNWYQDWKLTNQFLAIVNPFIQSDWPNPRDYPERYRSWERAYNLNLIGKDVLPFRVPFPQPGPLNWYEDWEQNLLYALTTQLPFRQSDWPLPTPPRADYYRSAEEWYNLNLIGKDIVPGQRIFDLPIIEFRDKRQWEFSYNLNLIGRDVLPIRIPSPQPGPLNWYEEWYLNNLNQTTFSTIIVKPFGHVSDDITPAQITWYRDQSPTVTLFLPTPVAPVGHWMPGLFSSHALFGQQGHIQPSDAN